MCSTLLKLNTKMDQMDLWMVFLSHRGSRNSGSCISHMQTQGGTVYQSYVCIGSLSNVLGGNFPCTGLNACNAGHDFNFFLLPRSLGVHPWCVCVRVWCLCVHVRLYLCIYVRWSVCLLNWSVCVCLHVQSWLIAVSMQDLEASADQVTEHE